MLDQEKKKSVQQEIWKNDKETQDRKREQENGCKQKIEAEKWKNEEEIKMPSEIKEWKIKAEDEARIKKLI